MMSVKEELAEIKEIYKTIKEDVKKIHSDIFYYRYFPILKREIHDSTKLKEYISLAGGVFREIDVVSSQDENQILFRFPPLFNSIGNRITDVMIGEKLEKGLHAKRVNPLDNTVESSINQISKMLKVEERNIDFDHYEELLKQDLDVKEPVNSKPKEYKKPDSKKSIKKIEEDEEYDDDYL